MTAMQYASRIKPNPDEDGGSTNNSHVPTQTVQVVLTRLYCAHTTEQGADEVFYMFGADYGGDVRSSHRGPTPLESADADGGTAWEANDSGSAQDRHLNAMICNAGLEKGQHVTLGFAFNESDGTDIGAGVKAAGALAGTVGTIAAATPWGMPLKIGGAIVGAIGGFIPKNEDDHLGSFTLRARNDGGRLVLDRLSVGDYTWIVRDLDHSTGTFAVRFRHDDGDYTAEFVVRQG